MKQHYKKGKNETSCASFFMHAFNNLYLFLVYKICTEYYDRGQQMCEPHNAINTHR